MLRNNLNMANNKGAMQLDWSFPLYQRMREWFNGHGESLIDYNARVNSLGVGIQVTDRL